jgi:hypothetical protein
MLDDGVVGGGRQALSWQRNASIVTHLRELTKQQGSCTESARPQMLCRLCAPGPLQAKIHHRLSATTTMSRARWRSPAESLQKQ